ncbi:hypothetical protein ES711_08615 [Gelidibacter salicanalis]|uniref:Uncharacterized protein n=1 Tax=Gelidibacter salicanalis TaxID=291193 RepID=A0A5C7AKW6_9FLAO|nr:hypothetical protein [Gelidibacter salicanalis]TXE08554.1 hypothetical protein ES711_08615 [Gelidibacter salicanalis]
MIILEIPNLKLHDLLDEQKFNQIKLKFIKLHNGNNLDGTIWKELENIEVFDFEFTNYPDSYKYTGVDSQLLIYNKEKLKSLNFYKDYLFKAINDAKLKAIGEVEIRRKNEQRYTLEEKISFYDELEEELIDFQKAIFKTEHLVEKLKNHLNEASLEIRDHIVDKVAEINDKYSAKLSFNISRENLARLFSTLHNENKISAITMQELARFMNKHFLVKNKPLTSSFRNRLTHYQKRSNWNVTSKQEINELLEHLKH